jgi:hypothetical protein
MVERDEKGRVKPGSVLNPHGHPKKAVEESFSAVIRNTVTPERFQKMLERQSIKAENGNLAAFAYICKLLGLEVQKTENENYHNGSLEILVRHVEINNPGNTQTA